MRYLAVTLLFAIAGVSAFHAQTYAPPQEDMSPQADAPRQTARQALLEMFTSRTADSFEKHLPGAARKALLKGGDASSSPILAEFVGFRAVVSSGAGQQLETFDSGPILLTFEEPGHKAEVMVERDDLTGDEDEIELSFRTYKDGEPEPLPVRPRLTFSMKEEKHVWTLSEITLAAHIPLADPEYLRDLQKTQNAASESAAVGNVRTLLTAETSYNATYSERGFTCKLSELGGMDREAKPSAQHALLIDPQLAGGKKGGYIFKIGGCEAPPSSKFNVTAEPADPDSGMRTYCATESGVVRSVKEGNGEACWRDGVPLQ